MQLCGPYRVRVPARPRFDRRFAVTVAADRHTAVQRVRKADAAVKIAEAARGGHGQQKVPRAPHGRAEQRMRKAAAAIGRRGTERIQIPALHRAAARIQRRAEHEAACGDAAPRADVQIPFIRRGGKQTVEKRRVVAERRVL